MSFWAGISSAIAENATKRAYRQRLEADATAANTAAALGSSHYRCGHDATRGALGLSIGRGRPRCLCALSAFRGDLHDTF